MNNQELIQEYLEVEVDTENTKKAYTNNLIRFEKYIKEKNFVEVLPKDIKLYAKYLADKYVQAGVDQNIATLKSFYNYLYENEYMQKNICATLKRVKSNVVAEPKEKESMTLEELKQLIEGIENADESSSRAKFKSFSKARDILIILLSCKLGLRCSEIIETRLNDINLKKKTITIDGSRRKNKETLVLPFDTEIEKALKKYLIERRVITLDLDIELFVTIKGKKLCNSDMNRMLVKRCKQTGVDTTDIHFHILRHSCSQILQQQGMTLTQVAKVLGHSSINTTFGSYTHNDLGNIREKMFSFS